MAAWQVHSDQYVSHALGTEILHSSSLKYNTSADTVNPIPLDDIFRSVDTGLPASPFNGSSITSSQALIANDDFSGVTHEFCQNPFCLEIPALLIRLSSVIKNTAMY